MFPPLRHIFPQLAGRVPAARNFLIVHSGLITCALFLLAGLFLAGDYDGTGLQVGTQRGIAQANLDYIRGLADTVDTPIYSDRGYGAAFELPLLLVEDALAAVNFPAAHRSRFLLTHLFFIVSGWFATGWLAACSTTACWPWPCCCSFCCIPASMPIRFSIPKTCPLSVC